MKSLINYRSTYSNDPKLGYVLRITSVIFIIFCLISVSGCGSSIALKKDDISANQYVNISKNVLTPETMYYQGPESIIPGLIGVISAAESGKTAKLILQETMLSNNIDVPQILRKEFEQQLINSPVFSTILPDAGNYPEIRLSISYYGFGIHGLSRQMKPMFGVVGQIVKPDGSVIWRKYDFVTPLGGETPSHTIEEYISNPELIREAFNVASKIVVSGLVGHMNGK